MEQAALALPRWKCHKEVWADRIKEVIVLSDKERTEPADYDVNFVLENGTEIHVPKTFIARGCPAVGDYFVRYDDGYQSWSPAKAFEDVYMRIGG